MARILIVDDDPDVIEAATLVLETEGFEVSGANSRQEGMEAVKTAAPDLMILDVMMEEADDGLALAQELRAAKFDFPILMLSGISKVSGIQYDKDDEMVPVNEFVEKPVDPKTLVSKVKKLLSGKEN